MAIYVNTALLDSVGGGNSTSGNITNIYGGDVIEIVFAAPVGVSIGAGAGYVSLNITPCLCSTTTSTTTTTTTTTTPVPAGAFFNMDASVTSSLSQTNGIGGPPPTNGSPVGFALNLVSGNPNPWLTSSGGSPSYGHYDNPAPQTPCNRQIVYTNNQGMEATGSSFILNNPYTIVLVEDSSNSGTSNNNVTLGDSTNANTYWSIATRITNSVVINGVTVSTYQAALGKNIGIITFNGTQANYFVNGILQGSVNNSTLTWGDVAIGSYASGSPQIDAGVCEIYAYNRVLTNTEIDAITLYLSNKWISCL